MEDIARLFGANRFQSFWHVSLPLARRGIASGLVLGFARALGEFGGDVLHRVMGVMTGFYLVLVILVARRGHSQLQGLVASQMQAQHSQAALDRSEVQRQASDERLRVAAEAGVA